MKNRIIDIVTNWIYSWPAWLSALIWFWLYKEQMLAENGWWLLLCIISGSLLMAAYKWWGCFVCSIYGVYCVAEYYYKLATGDLIKIDTRPMGLIIIAYFLFMGWLCYRADKKRKSDFK